MKDSYDVVVVGGGPGGCMAALHAAKNGATVCVLEKTRDIGYPVRCGEAAGESGIKQFVDIKESWNMLTFPGFWTMTRKYWKTGIQEWYRSLSKKAFTQALQRLLPKLEEHHLISGGSGVRAQAVTRDGSMVDDFRITQTKYAIHVRNAPSPGATASLAISNDIVGLVEQSFELPE